LTCTQLLTAFWGRARVGASSAKCGSFCPSANGRRRAWACGLSASSRRGLLGVRLNRGVASLATLVVLVLVLAFLQYQWISELSEAQEGRVDTRVRDIVGALTDAFDMEVTRSVLAFDVPLAELSWGLEPIERRWREWQATARWPQIISGVALLESSGGPWRAQWVGSPARSDVASLVPPRQAPFAGRLGGPRRIVIRDRGAPLLSLDGQPAVMLPLSAVSKQAGAVEVRSVIVHINGDYLSTAVFPQLRDAHATPEDQQSFQFELRRRGDSSTDSAAAVVADMFHFRPDCFGGSTTRRAIPLAVLLQSTGRCSTPPVTSAPGVMQLVVRRHQAPINPWMQFRWRNQVVSAVVLATLLLTMAMLLISSERARALARMQTVVAAGVSHELRTPLASLRLAADDLKSGHVDNIEQARRYGEIVDVQAKRLGHIVDQTIALASATAEHRSHQPRAVSAEEIIDVAITALSSALTQSNLTVERSISLGIPQLVVDAELIARCLTNLVENSIKYAASGAYIMVSARLVPRRGRRVVQFSVEDRGPGIDADEIAGVFEPFYRGTAARRSRQPGSGLGLAVVKSAVEAHGGWIGLERVDPRGCRLSLFLPVEVETTSHAT
jgi:signal transduction histidine kinase